MGGMARWLLAIGAGFLFGAAVFGAPDAAGEFRFRLGPFFEWGSREGEGMTRLAVRPFYAWERSEVRRVDEDMEVVWPLTHFAWRGDEFHWRVGMAFWQEADRTERLSRDYSFAMPPIWTNGRDMGKDYWGLFPIYGRLPKFFLTEDFQWGLFPLWLRYRTGGSRGVVRDYFGWPFFSLKYDADRTRWALWPLYGTKWEPEYEARFVAWPFWNDQVFHRRRHHGYAWMLWPVCERIKADTEWGWGVLPPLFRYSETVDGARLIRAPWPLFERYTDARESTWRSWRFWGMTHRGTRDGWWFMYPIGVHQRQRTENQYTRMSRFWPFYVEEETVGYDVRGRGRVEERYFRLWPFYSSFYREDVGLKRKALTLLPIRDVPAVERNWAPFWTFYTARRRPGEREVLHELFWGLIWWRTEAEDEAEGSVQ